MSHRHGSTITPRCRGGLDVGPSARRWKRRGCEGREGGWGPGNTLRMCSGYWSWKCARPRCLCLWGDAVQTNLGGGLASEGSSPGQFSAAQESAMLASQLQGRATSHGGGILGVPGAGEGCGKGQTYSPRRLAGHSSWGPCPGACRGTELSPWPQGHLGCSQVAGHPS